MMEKDPNYAIKIENAISDKYGEETVQNPKSSWSDEKEKQYLEDLKKLHSATTDQEQSQEQVNGVFISKKLFIRESKRSCPVCNVYSFKSKDDVYMSKFECCEKCYIKWVELREERWKSGWRPNNG